MTLIEARLISDAGLELGFLHELDPRDSAIGDWTDDSADLDLDSAAVAEECAASAVRARASRS